VFGGRLSIGATFRTTTARGYVCWYETPHSGDEHEIDKDDACRSPYAKAMLTEHEPFVAVNARELVQPR
jgi:hypothetical protein